MIPDKIIERYRKIRALAAAQGTTEAERKTADTLANKLREQYPEIDHTIHVIEHAEKARAQASGRQWQPPPPPTPEEWEQLVPLTFRRLGLFFGVDLASIAQRQGERLVDWATARVDEALDLATEAQYVRHDYSGGTMAALREIVANTDILIETEVEANELPEDYRDPRKAPKRKPKLVEVLDLDGNPAALVRWIVPLEVLDRVLSARNGATALIEVLRAVYHDEGDGDDEDEEGGEEGGDE